MADVISDSVFSVVTEFDYSVENAVAVNSLLFLNLFMEWTKHLRTFSSLPKTKSDEKDRRKRRQIIRLDEFTADEEGEESFHRNRCHLKNGFSRR